MYVCAKCGYSTKRKSSYEMHLKRKTPCKPIIINEVKVEENKEDTVEENKEDTVEDTVEENKEDTVEEGVTWKRNNTRVMISFIKNNLEKTIWRLLFLRKIYIALRTKFEN